MQWNLVPVLFFLFLFLLFLNLPSYLPIFFTSVPVVSLCSCFSCCCHIWCWCSCSCSLHSQCSFPDPPPSSWDGVKLVYSRESSVSELSPSLHSSSMASFVSAQEPEQEQDLRASLHNCCQTSGVSSKEEPWGGGAREVVEEPVMERLWYWTQYEAAFIAAESTEMECWMLECRLK